MVHGKNDDIDAIMRPFSAAFPMEPYEVVIARNRGEIIQKFGYIFTACKVFAGEDVAVLTEVLNDWFAHDESELFFCEDDVLKQISTKNPMAKHYRWHIDFEALKNSEGEYVETMALREWDFKSQFREEYAQSLFYWLNHDPAPLTTTQMASYEALSSMIPRAVIVGRQWVDGPQSDVFDMDLAGFGTYAKQRDMKVWISQLFTMFKPYYDEGYLTCIHFK